MRIFIKYSLLAAM